MNSDKLSSSDKKSNQTVQSFERGYGSEFSQHFNPMRSLDESDHMEIQVETFVKSEDPESILSKLEISDDKFTKQSNTRGYFAHDEFDVYLDISSQSVRVSSIAIIVASEPKDVESLGRQIKLEMDKAVELVNFAKKNLD
jgi:hypothetical protein